MYGSLYYSTTVKKYLIQIIFTPGEKESDMEEELRLINLIFVWSDQTDHNWFDIL